MTDVPLNCARSADRLVRHIYIYIYIYMCVCVCVCVTPLCSAALSEAQMPLTNRLHRNRFDFNSGVCVRKDGPCVALHGEQLRFYEPWSWGLAVLQKCMGLLQ
jgi:hypothetical protein